MIVADQRAWLVAGASLAPLLRDPRRSRVVNVWLAVRSWRCDRPS